ncbi:uncharacterized protein BKCO1_11000012 [Diplodia corticola]|uniref:TMEM205-like domain-containing protein n=1 Tax=Diplodia corticola TaxID=236234 RepID=A0A1J9QL80_9PEZI|nr:uncharacterized protein BKCO1_11000012 [Diplodia corticola]OJD28818.1 hypothetical protein BKCO1_11000012 [Diplodia corticola]
MTKLCYTALPAPAFTTLQRQVFPVYFRLQCLLLVATALTHPLAPPSNANAPPPVDAALLAVAGATAFANWLKYGPATAAAMVARIHQETRDGRKRDDGGSAGGGMRERKRAFSRNHAMSIHLNLLSMVATVGYGVALAGRLRFD